MENRKQKQAFKGFMKTSRRKQVLKDGQNYPREKGREGAFQARGRGTNPRRLESKDAVERANEATKEGENLIL